jgi:transcriptional regulator with XRE-family HTH domain
LENPQFTSELVRAARALLRWDQRQLAKASSVSLATIKRLEAKPGILIAHAVTLIAIRNALEVAGVEFTNGERLFFIQLYRWFPSILKVMTTIWPETLVRWHRGGFRRYWRWKSRNPRTRHSPSLVIFGHR